MKIGDFARGQWPKIIGSLLGPQYAETRKHGSCPATGEKGCGTPRYRFSDQHGTGNYFCQCSDGKRDGFALLMCARGYDFASACRDVESVIGTCPRDESDKPETPQKTFAERIRERACKTRQSTYLAGRGLEVAPGLDWIKSLSYVDENKVKVGEYPAMLAPITKGDRFLTYHVTYLKDGNKAPLTPCRKILPGPPNAGASCQLYPPAESMGIAEGVETAIAAKMIFGVPTWAALNTALLESWEPPAIAKHVFVFGDHDPHLAGHAAAYKLAHRLLLKGIQVEIQIPEKQGQDWNDVLLGNRTLAA